MVLRIAAVMGVAGVLAGCGSSSPASPPNQTLCTPKPQGALCLKLFRDGGRVTDVIAYLASSGPALTGKTWRLALGWGESGIAPGRSRHGNPPAAAVCGDSHAAGCDDTLAEAVASHGDFAGFSVPVASVPAPLCVHEQLQENGKWIDGPAKPACAG